MTLFNDNHDTGPVFEKGYPKHEGYEDYMKRRMREEDEKLGVNVEYTNMRLTKELEEIKEDIKNLQIDIAYMMKKYE